MAIEFFDGFEGYTAAIKPEWLAIAQPIPTSSAPIRTGNYAAGGNNVFKLILTASAKKTMGCAVYWGTYSTTNFFAIWGDAGATQHLTIQTNTSGFIEVRRGTGSGTLLATSTQVIDLSVWRSIQIQATIADSGGTCIVRVDNVEWINFTGDTKNAGTNTTIDAISFSSAGSGSRTDDVWVCNGTDDTATTGRPDNDFLGDLKVEAILPSGNGTTNSWTNSAGNSTNNYTYVDEAPPNTTDYVASSTSTQRDMWAMTDLSASTSTVYAIRTGYYAAKSDAGASSIKPLIRESGGTITTDASQALSTTYTGYYGVIKKVKPSNGAAWTASDVNGLQVGVELA